MKQTEATKLAYAAGFIDGEGCIRISTRNPRMGRSRSYNLLVSAVQKDGEIMDWFVGNFGGMVYCRHKDSSKENTYGHGWVYEWRVTERKAYDFLKQIVPFLRYKKPQAELGIRFQERRVFSRHKTKDDKRRFASLSQSELDERESIYQEMRRLKRIYRKAKNPNVVDYQYPSMVQE